MPMYDKQCDTCGETHIDVWEGVYTNTLPCVCGGKLERKWLTTPPNVISDECDVTVRHGICNEDGSPRRYGFKSEMRAEAKRRGMENHVVHKPEHKGGDSSKFTSRWI